MKIFSTLTILFFLSCTAFAQMRTITGRLTGSDGSPLPGVSVAIKGTKTGTSTDVDGNYSIEVPVGATLVFAFIGMQTREILVTENNLQPASGRPQKKSEKKKEAVHPIPFNIYSDSSTQNKPGVAVLTDKTESYRSSATPDPGVIKSIRRRGDHYIVRTDPDPVQRKGFSVQFSTLVGIENTTQLPSLQTQYAQGQSVGGNLQWAGPETKEIFSWGPLARTLEYDGSAYPFDKNGRLVPAGSGNGTQANRYDPTSFFRTGFVNANEIGFIIPTPKQGKFIFNIENKIRSGIIPNSDYKRLNASGTLDNFHFSKPLRFDASLHYNQSSGDLLTRGANIASIMGGIFRTPATFDNANGVAGRSAFTNATSYQLPDGSVRSHAPGLADNPYGLINELPDQEETQRLMGFLNLDYALSNQFTLVIKSSIDHQSNERTFGIPTGYAGATDGKLTDRTDRQSVAHVIATPAYHYYDYDHELDLSVSYEVDHQIRELNRTDGFDFTSGEQFGNMDDAKMVGQLHRTLTRTTHDILFNAKYQLDDWLTLRLTNRNYFSNTARPGDYTNLFPSLSAKVKANVYLWDSFDLIFNTSISRSIHEAPLLYSSWAHGSTVIPLEQYTSYYETGEIFFNDNLVPEIERKFETGASLDGGNLRLHLTYFNNKTQDYITPVATLSGFELQNVAAINNYGGTIYATYNGWMSNGSWETEITWGKWRTVVSALYSDEETVPLAGFESVRSVLAEGKSLGAIYGTTHVRNAEGKMVVDDNGYPIEDQNLKMIGDPTPDWNMGWKSTIRWKKFSFLMLFDLRKGGDMWNGTNSILDYLGRSTVTGNLRGTSNYVFDGVTEDGTANNISVSFYDPAQPVTENRWVRYGWDGIAEDYIEDATSVRLSQLALSYTLEAKTYRSKFESVKFTLSGNNLFIFTPYRGVDPASSLFGTPVGNGLDVFNMPSVRSYTLQVTFKL
jgi:hypothetical protein